MEYEDVKYFEAKQIINNCSDTSVDLSLSDKVTKVVQKSDVSLPYGYTPISEGSGMMGERASEKRDIEFFDCELETWFTLQPGEFALFFPNDAHAPLVGEEKSIRKAVFKIRIEAERY